MIQNFEPFETSDRIEGISWRFDTRSFHRCYLVAWRFTCTKWPNPTEVQQQVKLRVGDRQVIEIPLVSILTLADITLDPDNRPHNGTTVRVGFDRHLPAERITVMVYQDELFEVRFAERPVEGAGLRIHLRGVQAYPPLERFRPR